MLSPTKWASLRQVGNAIAYEVGLTKAGRQCYRLRSLCSRSTKGGIIGQKAQCPDMFYLYILNFSFTAQRSQVYNLSPSGKKEVAFRIPIENELVQECCLPTLTHGDSKN